MHLSIRTMVGSAFLNTAKYRAPTNGSKTSASSSKPFTFSCHSFNQRPCPYSFLPFSHRSLLMALTNGSILHTVSPRLKLCSDPASKHIYHLALHWTGMQRSLHTMICQGLGESYAKIDTFVDATCRFQQLCSILLLLGSHLSPTRDHLQQLSLSIHCN